ncbi:MAG: aminotransferase class V-fold PLP-dependent enzyme [Magnetococcales bacterium]|nr:aminotransferase class V-fold PLP-dependent enzyme [Magnetococcales bacterium]
MISPIPERSEFPLREGLVYLNHAGVAPIPKRSADKIAALTNHLVNHGASRYGELDRAQERIRRQCAQLIKGNPEQLAFVASTSEGLSFVALGIDWRRGDEIITTDQEFPSNIVIWLDIARRFGVKVHQVPSKPDGGVDAEALLERVNARTRVLAVSSVQFSTGAAVDIQRLGEVLKPTETLFVVDGIQSLGVLPMDVSGWGIDALAADGHKWLLSPEGCGLIHLSEKGMAEIQPRVLGWHSVANVGEYDRIVIEPRQSARRFEAGSPNILGIEGLGAGVELLLEVGEAQVWQRVQGLVGALMTGLLERGCRIHTPLNDQGRPGAGILIFSHPSLENRALQRGLTGAGIFQIERGRGIRLSPHFYQDQREVAYTLETLDRLLG